MHRTQRHTPVSTILVWVFVGTGAWCSEAGCRGGPSHTACVHAASADHLASLCPWHMQVAWLGAWAILLGFRDYKRR